MQILFEPSNKPSYEYPKGTGYLCHWHISCVQWVLVGSVRLKLDITKSVIPFSWKSIVIFFNAQRKAMILIHL